MTDDLHQDLRELIAALRVKDAPQLWTVADIAAWMHRSEDYVRRSVVTRKDFPAPTEHTKPRLWWQNEVIEWKRVNGGRIAA